MTYISMSPHISIGPLWRYTYVILCIQPCNCSVAGKFRIMQVGLSVARIRLREYVPNIAGLSRHVRGQKLSRKFLTETMMRDYRDDIAKNNWKVATRMLEYGVGGWISVYWMGLRIADAVHSMNMGTLRCNFHVSLRCMRNMITVEAIIGK